MKFALYTLAVLAISSSALASSTGVRNLRGRHLDTSITEDHKKNKKTSAPTNSTSALETRTEDVATVEVPAAETAPTDAAPAADPPSKTHSHSASSSGPESPAGETRTEEVQTTDPPAESDHSSSAKSYGPKQKEEVPPAVLETPAAETAPAAEVPAEVAPAEPEAPAEVTPVVVEAPAVEAAPETETDPAVEVPAEVAPAEPEAPAEVTPIVVEAPAVEAAPSAEIKARTCVGTIENYVGYPSTGSIHCTTDCDCISECCGLMTNSAQICTVPTLWDPRFRPTCLGR